MHRNLICLSRNTHTQKIIIIIIIKFIYLLATLTGSNEKNLVGGLRDVSYRGKKEGESEQTGSKV